LCKEGFEMTFYKTRKLMTKLKLVVKQRVAYKVTTKRKHSDAVADNLLNMNFNPIGINEVRAGDVTYLRTGEGWMYLAIVMDLHSRRIVGWHIDKRMTTDLVMKAMIKAYNVRKPPKGLVFHSDRGSQYTSKRFRKLLKHRDLARARRALFQLSYGPTSKTCKPIRALQWEIFKGGDLSVGSPTDTLLRLNPPHRAQIRHGPKDHASSRPHSGGLTGGVYKE
jgi:hypothetical protein